jgi:hypothetical protein
MKIKSLLDISADKFYQIKYGANLLIGKFGCTDEHGWLRGFVQLESVNKQMYATVTVTNVRDWSTKSFQIRCNRIGDEYHFDNKTCITVHEITDEWLQSFINDKRAKYKAEIAGLQEKIGNIDKFYKSCLQSDP